MFFPDTITPAFPWYVQANEEMRHHREARERAFVAEEEEYRRQLMAKFAEDDRLEQLNQQKRRLKVCRGRGKAVGLCRRSEAPRCSWLSLRRMTGWSS